MSAKPSDYAALAAILKAIPQVAELQGIIERALILEAEIPGLETRKAALQKDVAAATARASKAQDLANQAEAEHQGVMATLKAQREAETAGLGQERKDRAAAAEHLDEEAARAHGQLLRDLQETRDRLGLEVSDLQARKLSLERGIDDLIASHRRD